MISISDFHLNILDCDTWWFLLPGCYDIILLHIKNSDESDSFLARVHFVLIIWIEDVRKRMQARQKSVIFPLEQRHQLL